MEKNTRTMADRAPEVTTEPDVRPKGVDLDVDLEPADVWTLGLLIEADVAQFPPTVEAEILTAYRILQASDYRPSTDEEPTIDVETPDLPDPEGPSKAPLAREVVVAEVSTAEPEPAPRPEPPPEPSEPRLDPVLREEIQRLAEAVESVPERIDRLEAALPSEDEPEPAPDTPRQQAPVAPVGALAVVSGLASLLFATVVALVAGPVWAVLGLALLAAAGFGTYGFLTGALDESRS